MDMVLLLKAAVIGIVEGITEFLPISSTGHMIIAGNLINFQAPSYSKEYVDIFEVVIQIGAILAVVVLYWNKIINSLKNLMPGKWGFKLWINIIIAFLPSATIGLLFHNIIEEKLFNIGTVSVALILGGFLMIFIDEKFKRDTKTRSIDDVNYVQAFKIGCFQCLALWPGMSRSASTIMGAWVSGLNNVVAAEFSFFLAIPTMIGASGLTLMKSEVVINSSQIIALVVGLLVSFIVALVVVERFMNFLKSKPMKVFAIYRIFIGGLILILAFTKGIIV